MRWDLVLLGVAFGVTFLPSVASAQDASISVNVQVEALRIDDATSVSLSDCLLRLRPDPEEAPAQAGGVSLLTFAGGEVKAELHWRNVTQARDPLTGRVLFQHAEPEASRPVPFRPDRLFLSSAGANAVLELGLDESGGALQIGASDWTLRPAAAVDPAQWAATRNGDPEQVRMRSAPDPAGFVGFEPHITRSAAPVQLFIDGWEGRLEGEGATYDFSTGRQYAGAEGVGGVETDSWLTIRLVDVEVGWSLMGRLEGRAQLAELAWDGRAELDVVRGEVTSKDSVRPLRGGTMELDGRFHALIHPQSEAETTGAQLRLDGWGQATHDAGGPYANAAVATAGATVNPLVLLLAGSSLVGAGAVGARVYHRQRAKAPPAPGSPHAPVPPPQDRYQELVARVQTAPLDPQAHFDLGVELLQQREVGKALKHLERSFRLHPESLIIFLEDPRFAPVRGGHEVRQLLGRVHREYQRKLWSGYA